MKLKVKTKLNKKLNIHANCAFLKGDSIGVLIVVLLPDEYLCIHEAYCKVNVNFSVILKPGDPLMKTGRLIQHIKDHARNRKNKSNKYIFLN